MTIPRPLTLLIIGFALAIASPAPADLDLSLPDLGDPANQVLTPAEEREVGSRMMRELRREVSLLEDPALTGYLHDIGVRLAGHSELPTNAFEFFLIDDTRINAFAMPGGFIGLNTGVILESRRESELAAVLAHEMTHVSQRHLAMRLLAAERASLRTMAMILAGVLIGTQNPQAGQAAAVSGMASAARSQLAYSRQHEREADNLGLSLLQRAGFDPTGMPDFFGRLLDATRYGASPPPFLSTHPVTENRIADSRQRAESMEASNTFESPEFALMRARLAALSADGGREAVRRLKQWGDEGDAQTYGLAVALIRDGRPEDARNHLRQLLEGDEPRAAYYLSLADAELAAGNPDAALSALAEGLSLFPGNYALQARKVEALSAAGRHREAMEAAEDAVARHSWSEQLLELQARAADDAGEPAEAAIAMGRYYASRGELASALRQIEDVLASGAADDYQRSRAQALRDQWRDTLQERRDRE
ncbi:MAG: M48 family metalloprotease [Arhodomonas sp.]|nr:M48 family metalloprotease [Arhodomonas sp.]